MQNTADTLKSTNMPNKEKQYVKRKSIVLIKFLSNFQVAIGAVIVMLFVLMAVFAPVLAPFDPLETYVQRRLEGPSGTHLLGTDELGRDILSRIIFGARISLGVGVSATLVGGAIGTIIGINAGYFGGKIDMLLGRFIDVMLAFPGILLALTIMAILGSGTLNVIIAISIFAVPVFARIARGSTLNIKKMEYIDAIKAIGASDMRVMSLHIFPNIMSPIIVQATLYVANAIVVSAALSFLGVGTPPPTPEWGTMIANGQLNLVRAPHITFFPGLAILILIIAINMLGDGLRNALAPKD